MSLSFEDLKALLFLNRAEQGISPSVLSAFLEEGQAPAELLSRILEENYLEKEALLKSKIRDFDAEKEIESCEASGIRILTYWDEKYPAPLRDLCDPPMVLYMKGSWLEQDQAAVSIVGTRYPTLYGISQARRFSAGLSSSGVTIVSGMAQGIDLAAHQAALEISYGRTLAILGCGLDVAYPGHRKKYETVIEERGAFLSEYALGTPPLPENFPKRNRLIAGLGLGVLVVEAHVHSGSLITAGQALDQGKEIFAVPGPVDRYTSQGANDLIRQGAVLAASPSDILENLWASLAMFSSRNRSFVDPAGLQPELILDSPAADVRQGLDASAKAVLDLLSAKGDLTVEEVVEGVAFDAKSIIGLITRLEMRGLIQKIAGGRLKLLKKI